MFPNETGGSRATTSPRNVAPQLREATAQSSSPLSGAFQRTGISGSGMSGGGVQAGGLQGGGRQGGGALSPSAAGTAGVGGRRRRANEPAAGASAARYGDASGHLRRGPRPRGGAGHQDRGGRGQERDPDPGLADGLPAGRARARLARRHADAGPDRGHDRR